MGLGGDMGGLMPLSWDGGEEEGCGSQGRPLPCPWGEEEGRGSQGRVKWLKSSELLLGAGRLAFGSDLTWHQKEERRLSMDVAADGRYRRTMWPGDVL